MNQLFDWMAMGGYSIYVWPAYGVVCAVLVMNLLAIKRQKIRTRQKLQRWFKR
jgi:heme exporter protein D